MAAKVASLLIDIQADVGKIRKDFDTASKVVTGFQSQLATIGKTIAATFSVQQVLAFGEGIQRSVDAMSDMADNLKIPVQDFQALQNAALLAGQSIDSTSTAIGKFNVFVGKASEGSKAEIDRLTDLGVTINNFDGSAKSTTQRLQEMATAITSITDPAKRAAAEVAVFGKSGQQVSAILEQWKRPVSELNAELQRMGLVHSPEVIKSLADMADRSDIAAKKIEVLFAPFYAMAKSGALQAVAAGFVIVGNAINAINAGNIDGIVKSLAALALIPTIVGAPAGIALLQSIGTPLEIIDKQIATTDKTIEDLRGTLKSMQGDASITDEAKLAQIDKYNVALAKRNDLEFNRTKLTGAVVDMSARRSTGGTNPAIVGGGVDKFAEAMRRVREETEGAQKAITEFNKQRGEGTPTKDAERLAKLQQSISDKQSQMTKDLTPAQADVLKPLIEKLETLKFTYDKLKEAQRDADTVNQKYSDGVAAHREEVAKLNELKADSLIGEREYAAALQETNQRAEEQRLINQGLSEGITGIAAGWQFAALKMSEAQTGFQIGQQLFTASFQTMSSAISQFVDTGTVDFGKLATSFAKMLADMAAQMAIQAGLKAVFGLIGGAAGGSVGAPGMFPEFAPAAPSGGSGIAGFFSSIFGGGRATGGSVVPGYHYTVGESGPETFVPKVPGNIQPANSNGGGGDVAVNIDMSQGGGTSDPAQAMEFGRRVKAAVLGVISNEKRPGGTLYTRASA